MITTYKAAPEIDVLTSSFPVPGFGLIPINAFVLHAAEPVLVDTGTMVESDEFLTALRTVIDPSDLRYIWLTHTDFDHIGSLGRLLEEHAHIRVITSFLGVGIMGLFAPLPMERVFLINPGQSLHVGDRTLTAVKPPTFDNPITTGFHDDGSGALLQRGLLWCSSRRGPRERRRPLGRGAPPGPGLLGHGRLALAAQHEPGHLRPGSRSAPRPAADGGPEQPPARRAGSLT